jgi:hypothetical protein
MKADPNLHVVPLVVLGSHMRAEDIKCLYDENASCVIPLPDNFSRLEQTFGIIKEFWLSHARLPAETMA